MDDVAWKLLNMASGRIYTIGHGAYSLPKLVERLLDNRIQFIIDVRSVPYSRHQPEFSREALQRQLTPHGIRYVFMGDLLGGRPSDDDCYTEDGRADYAKIRSKEFFRRGIARLRNAHNQGFTVCLLCSEGRPSQCHRAKLVGQELADAGIEVLHIRPSGSIQTQVEAIGELTNGQESLFDELFFSRGVYR